MAITVVGSPTTATGGTTALSITRASVVSLNTLALQVTWFQTIATPPALPADSQGATVITALVPTPAGPNTGVYMFTGSWVIPLAGAGTHTITATLGSSTARWHASILELNGLAPSSQIDVNSAVNNATTAQTNAPGATTPTTINEIALACICTDSSTGVANIAITDPPTGFTSILVNNNTATDLGAEHSYRIKTTNASENPTWTWTDASTVLSQAQIIYLLANAPAPLVPGAKQTFVTETIIQF